jgi:hypothetical protein
VLNQHRSLLLSLLCLALSATIASAQPPQVVRNEITLRGTVDAVDHTARTITIRGDRGRLITLDAPASAVGFDQIKVGDIVTVAFYDGVSVRPKPPGEPAVDRTIPPTTTPNPNDVPGATKATPRVTTVTITGWDPATREVTFTGPAGASYSRRVLETTDASMMAGLKVGDRVDVTRTEAIRVTVQPATPAAQTPDPDEFRHRFTISALWGVDNGFSGHMLEGGSGLTPGGLPVNLNETSYDDVYGRISAFKIGVGYRTSPRTEVAINYVYSKSSAETATIGTVGTDNVPLEVNFNDYSYWGFEGGQRFFFARVRLTPYVGYLVGINRFSSSEGTFVEDPPVATPRLVEDTGTLFEDSWAFSFGPTAGLLIGLGPFEVMAETQLRYMGGRSDVEWLDDDALRTINAETSRWSLPFLFGGRIRF